MRAQGTAPEDRTASVTPPIRPSTPWRVREVTALPGYRLLVRFADGLSGSVDMSALIASSDPGVFASLRDPDVFSRVYLEHGAVMWPGELDLAPDAMHAEIKEHGEWRLT
jgi:Protein of unknown function (DUF2442)